MEYIEGKSLIEAYKTVVFPGDKFDEVLKLFQRLWSFGYVHGDAHMNNIMEASVGKQIMLIDLGLAMNLPKKEAGKFNAFKNYENTKIMSDVVAKGTPHRKSNAELIIALSGKIDETLNINKPNSATATGAPPKNIAKWTSEESSHTQYLTKTPPSPPSTWDDEDE